VPAQPVDATLSKQWIRQYFPRETDLFGSTRSKPSQDCVLGDLTWRALLALVFNAMRVRAKRYVDPLRPPDLPGLSTYGRIELAGLPSGTLRLEGNGIPLDVASADTSMLTGKLGFILLLDLTLALGSIYGAQQTVGPPATNTQMQGTPQAKVVLKEGTRVRLRLMESLDSERGASHAGHSRGIFTGNIEGVEFGVFPEVRVDDLVVIERGARAWGSAELKQKASLGRNGSVRVTALRALSITGDEIPLRGNAVEEGSPGPSFVELISLTGGGALMSFGSKVEAFVAKDVSFNVAAIKTAMAEAEQKKALKRAARGDKAVVYIYRLTYEWDEIVAALRDPKDGRDEIEVALSETTSVYLDGREVTRIPEFQCIALTLRRGKHLIGADKSAIELDLIPGEDYYLHISGGSKKQLGPVSREEGEEHIDPLSPGCEAVKEP